MSRSVRLLRPFAAQLLSGDPAAALAVARSRVATTGVGTFTTLNAEMTRLVCSDHADMRWYVGDSVATSADGWPAVALFRHGFHLPVTRLTGRELLAAAVAESAVPTLLIGGPEHPYGPSVTHIGGEIPNRASPVLRSAVEQWLASQPGSDTSTVFLALGIAKAASLYRSFTEDGRAFPRPVLWVCVGSSAGVLANRHRAIPSTWERLGLGWAYRLAAEPRRLAPRYARDAVFLGRLLLSVLTSRRVARSVRG